MSSEVIVCLFVYFQTVEMADYNLPAAEANLAKVCHLDFTVS